MAESLFLSLGWVDSLCEVCLIFRSKVSASALDEARRSFLSPFPVMTCMIWVGTFQVEGWLKERRER
jgi:hypothetical protein